MPPKKKKGKVTLVKPGPVRRSGISINPYAGPSADLNADWLKHLDDGRYQEEDLAALDAVYPPKGREEDEDDEEDEEDNEDE